MNANVIMLREDFSTFGLNGKRNFLSVAKNSCIKLDTEDDINEFMIDLLQQNACEMSAIFAIKYNNESMYSGIMTFDEEVEEYKIEIFRHEYDLDVFSDIDADYRLCCYTIIEEFSPGYWKVVGC